VSVGRRALNKIGGPYSITWTSFWITYALNLLTHFIGNPGIGAPFITRVAIVSLSQLAMWAVLLTGKALLLRDTAVRPRPFTTLALFAVAGIARGIVIGVCLSAAGGDASPQLAYRSLAGLFTISTVLTLTSLAINAAREHDDRLRALMASTRALEEARAHLTVSIEARNEAAVARIQRELLQEFTLLDPSRPAEAVRMLERTASDMVRPLSHELASSIPAWSPAPAELLRPGINWPLVFDLASSGRPLRPLATAVSLAIPSFIFTFAFFPPAEVLLLMLDALVTTWLLLTAGNALLARITPGRPVQVRVIAVTFTCLSAGAVIGFIAHEIAGGSVAGQWAWFGATVASCTLAWLITITQAVDRQHRGDEERLATTEASLRWQIARVRQVQWQQHRTISRALHGPIQGAITAAAMRLDAAVRTGADAPTLMAQTRDQLCAAVSILERQPEVAPGIDESLEILIGTWEEVRTIATTMDTEATAALDNDELCRSCLRDVLTDAISNAVRHGDASIVDISISLVGDEVLVRVRDNGATSGTAAIPGLGTRILDECSTRWSSEATDDGYLLTASLPVMP
jgi:signal transduction histidine kinase